MANFHPRIGKSIYPIFNLRHTLNEQGGADRLSVSNGKFPAILIYRAEDSSPHCYCVMSRESQDTYDYTTKEKPESKDSFHENAPPNQAGRDQLRKMEIDENGKPDLSNLDDVVATNAVLDNPLAIKPKDELIRDVEEYVRLHQLEEYREEFIKGALVAQNPSNTDSISELTEEDRQTLRYEVEHKWKQPKTLYYLVILVSMCAIIQGMDETVVNGAQIFYQPQLGLSAADVGTQRADWLLGLVNSAPYLACAVLGCWLTDPLNRVLGRRGVIFLSCFIAGVASIWEAVSNSWVNLFLARFVLGLGIGSKSTTVPVYTAECAPAPIRGSLVMQWQVWTAFGIMLGYVCDLAFLNVPDTGNIVGLNWRLMLGSTVIVPIFVCCQVYFCPESPRWLISKNKHKKAFESFKRLRPTTLQAARDTYYIAAQLEIEAAVRRRRNLIIDLFRIPRNRRAALASWVVMFMQQFCGVNVIAYYSSQMYSYAHP